MGVGAASATPHQTDPGQIRPEVLRAFVGCLFAQLGAEDALRTETAIATVGYAGWWECLCQDEYALTQVKILLARVSRLALESPSVWRQKGGQLCGWALQSGAFAAPGTRGLLLPTPSAEEARKG
jgi:hypothetical protein